MALVLLRCAAVVLCLCAMEGSKTVWNLCYSVDFCTYGRLWKKKSKNGLKRMTSYALWSGKQGVHAQTWSENDRPSEKGILQL